MQPVKKLTSWLEQNADRSHYLFTLRGLKPLYPELKENAFKALISRAERAGHLERVCRGVYLYRQAAPDDGRLLFHIAALLRADKFNYISLETALSDMGVISQIPLNWITLMSSGRSSTVSCGRYGTIEFVHTNQKATDVMDELVYDTDCGLWRASVKQALRDMRATHRNTDLIDWEVVDELV